MALPHIDVGGEIKNRAWNLIHGKPDSRLILQFATNITLSVPACCLRMEISFSIVL